MDPSACRSALPSRSRCANGDSNTIPLDFTGGIVIDPAKRVFYPADVTANQPVDPNQLAPVGLDKVRQYSVKDDTLVVTYLDASGKPTAVVTWQKRSGR